MNKKGQYIPPQPSSPFGNVNPLLIIGIVIFVIPFFSPIVKFDFPGWMTGVGVFVILIGAALSIYKASQN